MILPALSMNQYTKFTKLHASFILAGYNITGVVPGRVYKIHEYNMPWEFAHDICQTEGGNLAKVDKPDFHDWLKTEEQELWIGATKEVYYRVYRANCDKTKRQNSASRNSKSNLKKVSESPLKTIFCFLVQSL